MYSLESLKCGVRWELSEMTGNMIEETHFCSGWLDNGGPRRERFYFCYSAWGATNISFSLVTQTLFFKLLRIRTLLNVT